VVPDREAREVLADYDTLKSLAVLTGGQFVPLEGMDDVLHRLERAAVPIRQEQQVVRTPDGRGAWMAVLAMLGLCCGEWVLRRRSGLV
jgi:hypothetical protein